MSRSNWFCVTTLNDWLGNLAPLFHPTRSKTQTNRDSLAHVFPCFASAVDTSRFDWFPGLYVTFLLSGVITLVQYFCDTRLITTVNVTTKFEKKGISLRTPAKIKKAQPTIYNLCCRLPNTLVSRMCVGLPS